ncbi:MAG UNVERIFIED_CONTAM: hypothetical protein LVR29_09795 [Microcystis novacekii LVE1205-3]
MSLCDQLGISYKDWQTNLALEDAKAIISLILSQRSGVTASKNGNVPLTLFPTAIFLWCP